MAGKKCGRPACIEDQRRAAEAKAKGVVFRPQSVRLIDTRTRNQQVLYDKDGRKYKRMD